MTIVRAMIAGAIVAVSAAATASEVVKPIEGMQDKELTFSLESNPTTGYGWMIKHLPEQLIFVSSDYQQSDDCKSGMTGCPGKQTFTFIAQKPGKGELTLIHGRVFDKASWEETTVEVEIK